MNNLDLLFDYVVDWAKAHRIRFKFERVWGTQHSIAVEHVLDSGKVLWTRADIIGKRVKLSIPWLDNELNEFVHILGMCLDGTTYHGPYCWFGYSE